MNPNGDKLNALLKQWRDIEPRANFEANVRRRIRRATHEMPERVEWTSWLPRLLEQPAFSLAAALMIGLIVGLWSGTRVPARPRELGFMSDGTLAGGYLRVAAEERAR